MKTIWKPLMIFAWIVCFLMGCSAQGGEEAVSETMESINEATQEVVAEEPITLEKLLDGDTAWRSEPDEGGEEPKAVRELYLNADGSFRYRSGDPFSEFSYWAEGKWKLKDDSITFQFRETDEDGNALDEFDLLLATYLAAVSGETLQLTLGGSLGFAGDLSGEPITYQAYAG